MAKKVLGKRVVGIGGVFFKARNPGKLSKWYEKHLRIITKDNVGIVHMEQPRAL